MAINWNNLPQLDSVKLPGSDTKYWVTDTEAREKIETLASATHFLGVTTTELEDESTTNPIVINGNSVTAVSGDIAIYKETDHVSLEFIFDGTYWQLLGGQAIEGAGDLAYANSASASYTPDGNVAINVTASDSQAPVVTNVGIGDLNWELESYQNEGGSNGYWVLTNVDIGSSSSFVSGLSYNTTYAASEVASGSLPTLTDVSVSGVDVSMNGTTLVFTGAQVGYDFNAGSFPTYDFANVVSSIDYADSSVNIEYSTSGYYLGLSCTGSLSVEKGTIDASFNGSSSTITVTAD